MSKKIELVISPREKDLGGFNVRRILPYASHRMVGPFIFFDHMGPAYFPVGQGMDVRPHPHIGLATVTYLFEGKIRHRDSLGSDQFIEAGAINWMTAGRGIVHSERTPEELRRTGASLNGIQCWVALPEEYEDCAPSFTHHPASTLPEWQMGRVHLKLLLGSAFDRQSPVKTHSDLFYLAAEIPAGETLDFPTEGREAAVYVIEGKLRANSQAVEQYEMAIVQKGMDLTIEAVVHSKVMLLGGAPVGERFIFWNFVSSSKAKLDAAKKDWLSGPHANNQRFQTIPGDDQEFIPLPEEPGNPKGSIM